ncbi:Hsp70 family protein [Frigidibacter sp. RF13]|uniref:Hsp70 family protein n=1 Tax=Frigidibacter sp. RF13 TaxID=2997340 RepID=UPI00226F2CD6|nr:Hsp70 family protein [Frigidibacter sp. RF13]MCY1128080.1 Hsp70 family protein [Frigidibacter sp. RF13]
MGPAAIGVDFGTSNSAAAVLSGGRAVMIPLEAGRETLPTAVFLDYAARATLIGSAAVGAMIEGRDGRFMRALKSILGTPLARERRQFLNRRLTLLDIVAEFLTEVRARAEATLGRPVDRVVAGRPVRFHSADPVRNAKAAEDLAECYAMAGFREVRFLAEPEAAARATGVGSGLGLIVDIGGGTSDFTLFEPAERGIRVIASHGIRLGGTDFDRMLSLARVMPLLGMGGQLRNELGPGLHVVPQALFHELASWEKIAFLYSPATLREVRLWARQAVEPRRLGRLVSVIEDEMGHDVAFAVEAAKLAANDHGSGAVDLSMVETGLRPVLAAADLAEVLAPPAWQIGLAIGETLGTAGVSPQDVARVIFVGGSSLLGAVDRQVRALFPAAAFERSDVFTAVVRGLALAAAET